MYFIAKESRNEKIDFFVVVAFPFREKRPLHPRRISTSGAGGDFRSRARQIGSGEARRGRFLSRVDRSAVHKKSPGDSRESGEPGEPLSRFPLSRSSRGGGEAERAADRIEWKLVSWE